MWQSILMTHDVNKTASDWVAYASYTGPNNAPDEIFACAWALYDLVQDSPETAWEVIKAVIDQYPEKDFYAVERSEAQEVVGRLAAGPLEDLLSAFGVNFIGVVEAEARKDRRIAWTVGGVWQAAMPDDIWARVQRVADYTYWERPAIE